MTKLSICAVSLITFAASAAAADNVEVVAAANDVDVAAFEYIDVIEKTDGSILKGVVIEQEPGVRYKLAMADGSLHVIQAPDVVKLSKAHNKNYRSVAAVDADSTSVNARYEPPARKTFASSGVRADVDIATIFPIGRSENLGPTLAPTVRAGYEKLIGPLGVGGGGMARFTYWNTSGPDGSTGDPMWTVETHVYAKAAFHLGRVAPYMGVTLGTDLGFVFHEEMETWESLPGLGANLTTGISVAATRLLSLDVGADYHPDTRMLFESGANVEYLALRIGAQLRL